MHIQYPLPLTHTAYIHQYMTLPLHYPHPSLPPTRIHPRNTTLSPLSLPATQGKLHDESGVMDITREEALEKVQKTLKAVKEDYTVAEAALKKFYEEEGDLDAE